MSKPFRERNPVVIGAISLAVIAVMILAAFRAQDLPVIGGGDTYTAAFSEAGGLKANDPVRIAHTRTPRWDPSDDALTFDAVQAAFHAAGTAPAEQDTSA